MPQYCNSKHLEANWFQWIIGKAVPQLEPFRKYGLSWTKIIGNVEVDGETILDAAKKPFGNPSHPERLHCLAFAKPVYCKSDRGTISFLEGSLDLSEETVNRLLSLSSDSHLYDLDGESFKQQAKILPQLLSEGYVQDVPTDMAWHAMLTDINNMCLGIAVKFNPQSEEEKNELAGEALLQVVRKLERGRLVYTPGRAPVFNLLTTTIHRCMYSIMNKNTKIRKNSVKLANDLSSGHLSPKTHSLRVSYSQNAITR